MRLIKYKNKIRVAIGDSAKIKPNGKYFLVEEKNINRLSGKSKPSLHLTLFLFYFSMAGAAIGSLLSYNGTDSFITAVLLSSSIVFFIFGIQSFFRYRQAEAIAALKRKIKEKSQVNIL